MSKRSSEERDGREPGEVANSYPVASPKLSAGIIPPRRQVGLAAFRIPRESGELGFDVKSDFISKIKWSMCSAGRPNTICFVN